MEKDMRTDVIVSKQRRKGKKKIRFGDHKRQNRRVEARKIATEMSGRAKSCGKSGGGYARMLKKPCPLRGVRYIRKGDNQYTIERLCGWRNRVVKRMCRSYMTSINFGPVVSGGMIAMIVRRQISRLMDVECEIARKMLNQLLKIREKYWVVGAKALAGSESGGDARVLRECYGRAQYHVMTQESYGYDVSSVEYVSLSQLLSCSEIQDDQSPQGRLCDQNCVIDETEFVKIHVGLRFLQEETLSVAVAKDGVEKFETCIGCLGNRYVSCLLGLNCTDCFRSLHDLQAHFCGIRTLIRRWYHVRAMVRFLDRLDHCFNEGTWKDLMDVTLEDTNPLIEIRRLRAVIRSEELSNSSVELGIMARYKDQYTSWRRAIEDFSNTVCHGCDRLFTKSKVRSVPRSGKGSYHGEQWELLVAKMGDTDVYNLCRMCHQNIKKDCMYRLFTWNRMALDQLPVFIQGLNQYELLLVQPAKCFMTIIKLHPYNARIPSGDMVQALRGLAVHLPLPRGTVPLTLNSLPNTASMEILVDSAPTKAKNIWRSLVDLVAVKEALVWFKDHNPLYKEICIDFDNFQAETASKVISYNMDAVNTSFDGSLIHRVVDKTVDKQYTVYKMQSELPNLKDTELYSMDKVTTQPLSDQDKDLDLLVFPHLFPLGRYGMYDGDRRVVVKPAEYVVARLRNKDARFRRDPMYLLHAVHLKDVRDLNSGIFATMKTCKERGLTAGALKNRVREKDEKLEGNLTTVTSQIKGGVNYWRREHGNLLVRIMEYGAPSLFLTLSCSEYDWEDMAEVLRARNADIPNIDSVSISSLCVRDPVTVCEHFHARVRAFFKYVILDKDGPLGVVEHYYYRVEYQARGAPHVHCLLWLKEAPKMDEDPKVIVEFYDKLITCRMPDKTLDPVLYDLVSKKQLHKCSRACLRTVSYKANDGNMQYIKRCRHGFPRELSADTCLNDIGETIRSRRSGKRVLRLLKLQRFPGEEFVNDYNATLLLFWGANMDISIIANSVSVALYITKYIAKREYETECTEFWESVNRNKSLWSRLKSYGLHSLKDRDIGLYEAADKLMGHQLHHSDEGVKFLGVYMKEDRRRRLKSCSEIEGMCEDSTDVFFPNVIDTYYPNRPDELENCCLYEFVRNYEVEKVHGGRQNLLVLKNDQGFLRLRLKPSLVRVCNYRILGNDTDERYYHQLLMLFQPWRVEEEILGSSMTYEAAFILALPSLEQMAFHHSARQKIEEAMKFCRWNMETEPSDQCVVWNEWEIGIPASAMEKEDVEATSSTLREMSAEEVNEIESSLNQGQHEVFDEIVGKIQHQEKHKAGLCECEVDNSIQLFVTGVAGTGKSHLIKAVSAKLNNLYGGSGLPVVAVVAPTGLAALNVDGETMHKFFKLPVQHNKDVSYWELGPEDEKLLRTRMSNCHLVIIDEISMVSNVMLLQLHLRLTEIRGSDSRKPFGGRNLLLMGDFLQLPPVESQFCFESLPRSKLLKLFGASGISYNLWHCFKYMELTENMRQGEDLIYCDMLNRIRIGQATREDIVRLRSRCIKTNVLNNADGQKIMSSVLSTYLKLMDLDPRVLCLMPKNEQVDAFNKHIVKEIGLELVTSNAYDFVHIDDNTKQRRVKRRRRMIKDSRNKQRKKTSETAGLEETLVIAVGARVMLRRNISQNLGLVNGVMGTVKSIKFSSEGNTREPQELLILFDGQSDPVSVQRCWAPFEISSGVEVCRSQLPVSLAYAITIHKSQGLSLDCAVVDIGQDCFEAGMAYVALSRVRRLENVYLVGLDCTKIVCNRKCCMEYNRLREKYTSLPLIDWEGVNCSREMERKRMGSNEDDDDEDEEEEEGGGKLMSLNPKTLVGTSRVERQKRLRYESSESVSNSVLLFIRFANPAEPQRVSCYANASVQTMLNLSALVEVLKNDDGVVSGMIGRFDNLLRRSSEPNVQSTRLLREVVSTRTFNFGANVQQDVFDFWNACYSAFPASARELFQFQRFVRLCCLQCGLQGAEYEECTLPGTMQDMLQAFPVDADGLSGDLVDYFSRSTTEFRTCDACDAQMEHQKSQRLYIPNRNRYLRIELPIFSEIEDAQGNRMRMPRRLFYRDGSEIFNARYRNIAAIEHQGNSIKSGHYLAWQRIRTGWRIISDDKARTTLHLPPGLAGIYMLLLERIS